MTRTRLILMTATLASLPTSPAPAASQSAGQPVPAWTVDSTPLLKIGDSPDNPLYQLDRVSAAVWLGTRGLVIANHGDEVRYYDANGRHRVTTGRSGDGPGEFRLIPLLAAGPDSTIIVYDSRLQRISTLDRNGKFLRSFQLNHSDLGVGPGMAGVLDDGSVVTTWFKPAALPPNGGISTTRLRLIVFSPTGVAGAVVGEAPGPEAFSIRVPGRGNVIRKAPFSPVPRVAARGAHIYDAEGVSFSARVRDARGRQIGVAGDADRRAELTERIKSAFLSDTLKAWPADDRPRVEASLRRMMVHEHMPLVADMRVDDDGNVWLQGRDATGPASHWEVFSPTGAPVARVALPPHVALLDIAGGAVVLLQTGAWDEHVISVYPLNRRGSGR